MLHAALASPLCLPALLEASVLVDTKDPHAVELGQLGQKDAEQGGRVDDKVHRVVFGVEAGEEVPGGERETLGELCVAPTLPTASTGGISGALLVFPAQNSALQLGNPLDPGPVCARATVPTEARWSHRVP